MYDDLIFKEKYCNFAHSYRFMYAKFSKMVMATNIVMCELCDDLISKVKYCSSSYSVGNEETLTCDMFILHHDLNLIRTLVEL